MVIRHTFRHRRRNPVPAVIHHDSEYARDIAVRVAAPHSNKKLTETVATLVEKARDLRPLSFKHVKGHSQDVGNDAADKYANWGREGRVSCHWTRGVTYRQHGNIYKTKTPLQAKRGL